MSTTVSRPSLPNRSHRGDAVVSAVLDATREELIRVGYRALRIEEVATRANVNRTTVYRRWPTKVELVRDTLRMMFEVPTQPPDTGTLRADLLEITRRMLEFLSSANGQILVRVVMAEGTESELRAIVDELLAEKDANFKHVIDRAKARGEVCADLDYQVLLSSILGALIHRLFGLSHPASSIDLAIHVDMALYGVQARPTR